MEGLQNRQTYKDTMLTCYSMLISPPLIQYTMTFKDNVNVLKEQFLILAQRVILSIRE